MFHSKPEVVPMSVCFFVCLIGFVLFSSDGDGGSVGQDNHVASAPLPNHILHNSIDIFDILFPIFVGVVLIFIINLKGKLKH